MLLSEAIRRGTDAPLEGYTLAALAAASWSFRACHAYWRHLTSRGERPSLVELLAASCRSPLEIPKLYVTWRLLERLSAAIDPIRARRHA